MFRFPASTIKKVLKGQQNFTTKQLKNCNVSSTHDLVKGIKALNLLSWNDVKERSIVKQSGEGISISNDGKEVTLIVSNGSKYRDAWTDEMLIFEGQSPKDDDGIKDLTEYRKNPKFIRAIMDGTLDLEKLKIFVRHCSNGWSFEDYSGKMISLTPNLTPRGDMQFILQIKDPTPETRAIIDPKQQIYLFALFMILYRLF